MHAIFVVIPLHASKTKSSRHTHPGRFHVHGRCRVLPSDLNFENLPLLSPSPLGFRCVTCLVRIVYCVMPVDMYATLPCKVGMDLVTGG